MIISDLNYLQTAEENVQGGYQTPSTFQIVVSSFNLTGKATVSGNSAGAEADSNAYGPNTTTQAITNTVTVAGKSSQSNATSLAASTGATSSIIW